MSCPSVRLALLTLGARSESVIVDLREAGRVGGGIDVLSCPPCLLPLLEECLLACERGGARAGARGGGRGVLSP